jgi:hypothetical protein
VVRGLRPAGAAPDPRAYHAFARLGACCCCIAGRTHGNKLVKGRQLVVVWDAAANRWLTPGGRMLCTLCCAAPCCAVLCSACCAVLSLLPFLPATWHCLCPTQLYHAPWLCLALPLFALPCRRLRGRRSVTPQQPPRGFHPCRHPAVWRRR